nr:hypothetical protein [Anaerolineae bacterium]
MKARPRSVERRVAEELSKFLEDFDVETEDIERIPVLGRTGPDLTFPNFFNLAVDVKSRQSIPKGIYDAVERGKGRLLTRQWAVASLYSFPVLWSEKTFRHEHVTSTTVNKWLNHMAEWTDGTASEPAHGGIPALILHITGTPIKSSLLVLRRADLDAFRRHMNTMLGEPAQVKSIVSPEEPCELTEEDRVWETLDLEQLADPDTFMEATDGQFGTDREQK